MKKTITALILIMIIALGLGGCVPMDIQAKALVDENLKNHQTGGVQAADFQTLAELFDEGGLSDSSQEKLMEAYNAMIKKMTYSIQSCAVDPNNDNVYIVRAELETVDGNAIFIDEVPWDQIVSTVVEQLESGEYNEDDLEKEILEKWADYILEKTEIAEATKSTIVDIEVEYDKKDNMLYTEVKYNELLGLSKDFKQLFDKQAEEVAEMINASFSLEYYAEVLNEVYKDMEDEYHSIFCTADGTTFIFTVMLKVDDVTKEDAEDIMDFEADVYEKLFDEIREANIPCDKVVVEYRGPDNELLASREEILK